METIYQTKTEGLITGNIPHVSIAGVGVAFPEGGKWVTNEQIHELVHGVNWQQVMKEKGLDPDYIKNTLGYENRFWVHTPGEPVNHHELTSADLMIEAAKNAIESSSISKNEIDLVIAVTITSPSYASSMGAYVAGKLGISAPAFEMKAGCTSALYAMQIGFQFIQNGARHVLITIGETTTKITNRTTNLVYAVGDGGAALILSKDTSEKKGLVISWMNTHGEWSGQMGVPGLLPPNQYDLENNNYYMHLSKDTENFIAQTWKQIPEILFGYSGYNPVHIDVLIPHQVNKKILNLICEQTQIHIDKTVNVISKYANCGSVSIVLALHHAIENNLFTEGKTALLAAVGGGIAWGGMIIQN